MTTAFIRRAIQLALLLLVVIGGYPAMAAETSKSPAPIRIVALGDSLTAGYGLPPADAFPAQLERALRARGHAVEVINAGVSGDTSAAGLERFDWAVTGQIDAAIVELGANDALRGIRPSETARNLDEIVRRLKARGAAVLLTGMRAPRNWGEDYRRDFDALFGEVAARHGVALYPFFLDGVLGNAALALPDGLHPTGKGVAVVVERILPFVEALIAEVRSKSAATTVGNGGGTTAANR